MDTRRLLETSKISDILQQMRQFLGIGILGYTLWHVSLLWDLGKECGNTDAGLEAICMPPSFAHLNTVIAGGPFYLQPHYSTNPFPREPLLIRSQLVLEWCSPLRRSYSLPTWVELVFFVSMLLIVWHILPSCNLSRLLPKSRLISHGEI